MRFDLAICQYAAWATIKKLTIAVWSLISLWLRLTPPNWKKQKNGYNGFETVWGTGFLYLDYRLHCIHLIIFHTVIYIMYMNEIYYVHICMCTDPQNVTNWAVCCVHSLIFTLYWLLIKFDRNHMHHKTFRLWQIVVQQVLSKISIFL